MRNAGAERNGSEVGRRRKRKIDAISSTRRLPGSLRLVIQEVLADRRFSLPWIAVRRPDSSTWFVAERFESAQRFDRVCVDVTAEEAVTANITAYEFVLSDWAILGKLFVDFDPEARTVAAEIAKKLNDKGHAQTSENPSLIQLR